VTFGLKGDVALAEWRAILLNRRVEVDHVATADLQVAVVENRLAIDDVTDALGAEHLDLDPHPLVAAIGLGSGVEAVRFDHLPISEDFRARGADVRGGALTGGSTAQELGFDGDWEVLVLGHGVRSLAVEHDAVVAKGPTGSALDLLADEAVLRGDDVMGELPVSVEDVAKPVTEVGVLVVGDSEDAVLDTECVAVVLAEGEAGDFGDPTVEVLALNNWIQSLRSGSFCAKAAAPRKRRTAAARGKVRGMYSAYIRRGRSGGAYPPASQFVM